MAHSLKVSKAKKIVYWLANNLFPDTAKLAIDVL